MSTEVTKYICNNGFKINISAGAFILKTISVVQVENGKQLETSNSAKDGEAIVMKGHQDMEATQINLLVRFTAVNPAFISSSSISITFTKRYDRDILLSQSTTKIMSTVMQDLDSPLTLALGWGVGIPDKTDTLDRTKEFKIPAPHPFYIMTGSANCKTPGDTKCLPINTITYKFKIDHGKYLEGVSHTVKINFLYGSASLTNPKMTVLANSIHTNLSPKHVDTSGTTTDANRATCNYYYKGTTSHNYIQCDNVFLQKNTDYTIAFRMGILNTPED